MKTAENRSGQFQMLGVQLQAALQSETLLNPPIQVRCGMRQGVLLVLAQHPIALPEPRRVFALLEQALRQMPRSIAPNSQPDLPVRLLLQVVGQQPYASHRFSLEYQPSIAAQNDATLQEPAASDELEPPGQLALIAPVTDAVEAIAALPVEPPLSLSPPLQQSRTAVKPLLAIGAAVGLMVFVGSYLLTRPCVLGACVPLQSAEQLSQSALQTLQNTTSAEAVVEAYDKLVEASYLVSTIPPWSKQHAIAQTHLQTYTAQTESLEQIVSALHTAQTAAEKSQNPPHPFREWQEIQGLWQQAIAQLKQVPADSPVYALAQRKLTEYQANLTTLNQRIALERQSQEKVAAARDTARIAEAREGIATSLEAWQLTHATWQTVVNLLLRVPQSTMARAEAQQLLAIYEPKLAAARDRHTQEEISAKFYSQALSLAEQARFSEHQNQWSQAAEQWQTALANAQQVPNNTSYYGQAQSLMNAYTAALTRSQEILKTTVAMQSAAADLDRTCAGTPKVCNYSFTDRAIRVNITADYDRAVEQTMTRTQLTGDSSTQAAMNTHVNTLLRALAAISENANVPLELYNSDGSLFGTYLPEFSGYVAR